MSPRIPYTPEQASAVATVHSEGSLNPRDYYAGYMRFLGVVVEPTQQNTPLAETTILDHIRSTDTDPITTRRQRAQAFAPIWSAICTFAEDRRFTVGTASEVAAGLAVNPLLPPDLLGVQTRDPAGQAVLMRVLARRTPLHEIALAFSIPFKMLGERLLEGELIGLRDSALQGAAIKACGPV